MNISVIGSGSWGIALSIYLAKQGNTIKVWSFDEKEQKAINEEKKCIFYPILICQMELCVRILMKKQ